MVLSDADLRGRMADGELEIDPFEERSLTPNGYDLSVAGVLIPGTGAKFGSGSASIPPKSWFVLSTRERVRLGRSLSAQLWLRTTFARKGILATFGKIDAGFNGTLTITAFNASETPVDIPVGERFCQMVVERLDSPAEKAYAERSGRYQHQRGITLSAGGGTVGAGGGPGNAGPEERAPKAEKGPPGRPDSGEQPCRRNLCDHCCHLTEMPLTMEDIRRIGALGFDEKHFVQPAEGWLQLKNTAEGRCFFLQGNACSIYHGRPEGCTLYPAVYDADNGETVFDTECPHREEYVLSDGIGRKVAGLVERLRRERRGRRYRKVRTDL